MSGLTVSAEEYSVLSEWLVTFVRHDPSLGQDSVAILQRSLAEAGVGARARQGLASAIGDCMAMAVNWPPAAIAAFNSECASNGLPSLADIQLRFWNSIRAIQARGHIRTETEYYALREAVEMITDPEVSQQAWDLLWAFEEKAAPKGS